SRRRHTRFSRDWSSDVCSSDLFGGQDVPWRVHIINLRHLSHDLTPFVLGSLLELYAYELFRRGQENKIPTLLVLEEAHHYLRPRSEERRVGKECKCTLQPQSVT